MQGAEAEESKILILDDDELVTQALSLLLTLQTNYKIYVFNSPFKALDFLQNNDIDLIISDYLMSELNGIEFLSKVKEIKPEITMILLTGYADKENAIKAINDIGLYKYIEKPWDADELLVNIKNGLERNSLLNTVKMQKEIERLRDDFTATLTHDLRTPLLADIQALKYFLDGTLGTINEKQQQFLTSMLNSNQDMLGLVNSLLEVYKYEAGTHILYKDNFNFSELIHRCIKEVSSLLKDKNLTISQNFSEDISLHGDKQEIKRVVMNFLGNAILHAKSHISISVENNKEVLKFSISDDGDGISDEDQKKLFVRFSQGTSKKRSAGTGLGLYLSRQIIEAHGGIIGVKSELENGSTFYFYIEKQEVNNEQ